MSVRVAEILFERGDSMEKKSGLVTSLVISKKKAALQAA
jgi:hypothetical protein